VIPPNWILWNGQWGASFGFINSPRSPGVQTPWGDPWGWENGSAQCSLRPTFSRSAQSGQSLYQRGLTERGVPPLPRILSARIVTGTKYGKAVRVSYCFRTMPTNPWRRPSRLHLTLDNRRDKLPPLSVGWKVTKRCGTITHPVGPIKRPYLLRYSVESRRGTWSKRVEIAVR
jgi:hypothetical protein